MRWVRLWLPIGIVVLGLVIIVTTGGSLIGMEGGAAVIGAGLSVWLLNFFFRVGVKGDLERDDEVAARDFFDAHGYWPDEAPPPAPEPRRAAAPPDAPHAGSHHDVPDAHPRHGAGRPGGATRRPPRRP